MLATKLRITKTAMVSPKVAGRAALSAAEAAAEHDDLFQGLLFNEQQPRQ